MLKVKFQYFGHLMWRTTHWERPWFWERLKVGGEGDDRGWDGWMSSPTQWTWVWASSRNWQWTGKPGVLSPWGYRELDTTEWQTWTELNAFSYPITLLLPILRKSLRRFCSRWPKFMLFFFFFNLSVNHRNKLVTIFSMYVYVLSCVWFLWPHRLVPTRLLCPWNFPGKNTGAHCHFLLQDPPDPVIELTSLVSPALAGGFFTPCHLGSTFSVGIERKWIITFKSIFMRLKFLVVFPTLWKCME